MAKASAGEIGGASLAQLERDLRGALLLPGTASYDEARTVWNALVDKRPALIVRCEDADDVAHAIAFAREHELPPAIRGGGHNIAGNGVCDRGVMVDLSAMKEVTVDPEAGTARAGPGLRLGELDRATQARGLATTMGIASDTGIAGLTLGGGYGWLAGAHGLACDNLVRAEIVAADGRLVSASESENPDLFWGLRGGGGNFGVVTSFEYALHPVGKVLGGIVLYPPTAEALRFFGDFAGSCPDEVSTAGLLTSAPDGSLAFAIVVCHCGPIEEGERALAPLREFGPPLADMLEPRDYVEMQAITDESWPPGNVYYWKSSLVRALGDEAIDVLLEHAARKPTPGSVIYLQQLHGAAARVDPAATAFPHRFDHFNCGAMFQAAEPIGVEEGIRWARECWEAMQPHAERGNYVNDLGDEGEARVREAYGPGLERLRELKERYDPSNVFRLNQNVAPAG